MPLDQRCRLLSRAPAAGMQWSIGSGYGPGAICRGTRDDRRRGEHMRWGTAACGIN